MSEHPLSNLGDLLDSSRWTVRQKAAAAMAAAAILLDGLDIQILGFAVPSIAHDWHLAKSSFTLIFAVSLLAVAAGTFLGGILGDRFGRRAAILTAVVWFGVSTLLLAAARDLSQLFVYRMISGLGIGAALPNATAFIAEITPRRFRTTIFAATVVCIPLGGFLGGTIAASVLPVFSWRVLLATGGVLPLALAVLLFFALPESPRYLASQAGSADRLRRQLLAFGIPVPPEATLLANAEEGPAEGGLGTLLHPMYLRDTLSLWIAFCFCLVSIYLVFNWLPSMLSSVGLTPSAASSGLAIYNLGGVAGSILLGMWMTRDGSRIPLLIACVCSVLSALWLANHLVAAPNGSHLLSFQLGLHGFCTNAVQTALYALAAHSYPTSLRSRGIAAASAFGRVGAVGSAFLGGNALHHATSVYFYILVVTLSLVTLSLLFRTQHLPGTGRTVG